jgi:hypothetical protein
MARHIASIKGFLLCVELAPIQPVNGRGEKSISAPEEKFWVAFFPYSRLNDIESYRRWDMK